MRGLGRLVKRLNRRTERLAAAASVLQGGAAPGSPGINAAGVRVALDEVGEAEREEASAPPDDAAPGRGV